MTDSLDPAAARLKRDVENALALIETLNDATRLKQLHTNIQRHKDLDDMDRERLNEATMNRLRRVAPALATRLGGPKDGEGRDFLTLVWERAAREYDLSANKVGHGVKTGGFMINGTRYVDVYVSYKSADNRNLSLAWIQQEIGDKPYLELLLRHVGGSNGQPESRSIHHDRDAATEAFLTGLDALLNRAPAG